jgi:hypothetical protein
MITSAETTEVAEPSTEVESEERVEVADPLDNGTPSEPNEAIDEGMQTEGTDQSDNSGRTESDAAFAEMRRKNEGLEHDVQILQDALSRYFDGETPEELALRAQAYSEEREYDDVKADYDRDRELEELREQVRIAEEERQNLEIDQLIAQGLRDVQEIDPTIKSLEELGETFANFIGAGLSAKQAYYATQQMEAREKIHAPDGVGKIADNKTEREYYTSEELDNLTDEEMDANWEKVKKSLARL